MARKRIHNKRQSLVFGQSSVDVRQMSGEQVGRTITCGDLKSALLGEHWTNGYNTKSANLTGKEWGTVEQRQELLARFGKVTKALPVKLTKWTHGGWLYFLVGQDENAPAKSAGTKDHARKNIMYDLMSKIPTMGKKKASKQLIVYESLQQLSDRIELIAEHLDNLEVLTTLEFYS